MDILVNRVINEKLKFDNNESEEAAKFLSNLQDKNLWSQKIGQMIQILWTDTAIRKAFDSSFNLLNDNANFFFDNIDRILSDQYVPSYDDILRIRIRTTGIEECEFSFDKTRFKVTDVGGQRSERRKWIHCFSDVNCVIFCASIIDYCKTLRECDSSSINRMTEAIELFSEISNSAYFSSCPIILFLNKMDLFKSTLERFPLQNHFSKYEGNNDLSVAGEYIKARFVEQMYNNNGSRFYSHFTCAIDIANTELIFNYVRRSLLQDVYVYLPC